MKIKYIYLLIALMIVGLFTSCNEDDWLQRTPKDRITDEQLWNDPNMILGLLANYYDRLPQLAGVFNTGTNAEFDDAMWSGHVDQNWRNDIHYGDDYARYWDYTFIRHILFVVCKCNRAFLLNDDLHHRTIFLHCVQLNNLVKQKDELRPTNLVCLLGNVREL